MGNRKINNQAQVFLETSLAIIVLLFFMVSIFRVFVWMNSRLIDRQTTYDATRSERADNTTYLGFYGIDESKKLHIFPQEEIK